ncbi:MAG: hypothetical protein ACQEXJ_12270 [Myxococcota bacterium]
MSPAVPRAALLSLTLAIGVALPAPAAAEVEWEIGGKLRYRSLVLSDFPVDADGFHHGQESWGTAQVRIRPEVRFTDELLIHADLQALNGQIHGDDIDLGGDAVIQPWRDTPVEDQLMVREAWIQVPIGIGLVRVGRMTSHWGLGLVANDGDEEAYGFADATHGDVVNRALVILRPYQREDGDGALIVSAGADLVEQDELTDRGEGDDAWQVIGAVAWRQEAWELGTYVAYRDLTRDDGRTIQATAVDLSGRWERALSERYHLKLAFEGAVIVGTTDEFRFEEAPEEQDVRQFGGVVKGGVSDTETALRYGLEAGFASGDEDTQDGTLRAIRFDPAYKVGMILFHEVLARASARGYDRVSDPALSGVPPQGVERLPTNGSITNAAYLFPQIAWAPYSGRLVARLGALLAFAPADVVDPYASAEAGGFNRNAWGKADADGLLGVEVDAGLEAHVRTEGVHVRIGAQYGVLEPGPALGAASGAAELGTVHKVRLMTDVRW